MALSTRLRRTTAHPFPKDHDTVNSYAKNFLFAVIDQTCNYLVENQDGKFLHLPMWLMELYNLVDKTYTRNKELTISHDIAEYRRLSEELFLRIDRFVGSGSARQMFRMARKSRISKANAFKEVETIRKLMPDRPE